MTRKLIGVAATMLLGSPFVACSSDDSAGADTASSGSGGAASGGASATGGGPGSGGKASGGSDPGQAGGGSDSGTAGTAVGGSDAGGVPGTAGSTGEGGSIGEGGSTAVPTCEDLPGLIEAYKAAHPGNDGQDWDINAKSPAEIAADPEAQALLSICGEDQRPIIPQLAWEYGGNDHPWANPEESALAYCVYTPVSPSSDHWQYDAEEDNVTADVYVVCPDQNPCNGEEGADQVLACLGDDSNIEILVDTASLDDGQGAGYDLSEASTDLNLILEDGSTVHLYTGL